MELNCENSTEVILGIDLGTTNSEVALLHKGKTKILSIDGSKIIPSVISLNAESDILIGKAAVNNELAAPNDTVRTIKRRMGLDEVISLGNNVMNPQMLSSLILKRLKLAAEEFLGHSVSKAVITVPAFFNEKQREATKEAAELAGLEAVRLINEPTAAALAYSMGKMNGECCLVYDLGGGTFDVSIVQLSEGLMEVIASHGDAELGGVDFDRLIAERARKEFIESYQIDLAKDPLAWARVMRAAEAAKIKLSTEAMADIHEEFIASNNGVALHLKFTISRTEYEALIIPTIERTLISVRSALLMAEMTASKLDRIILVGGATYTPMVAEMLEKELKLVPQAWLDPSLVVAMGAAIEAANISGQSIGPMMVDITPHSLGTSCFTMDDYIENHILIRRNSPLPCTASRIFYKMSEKQDGVRIQVYQGESVDIHQNQHLGSFELEGLSGGGRDLCISYTIDASGLLHASVTDISTGKKSTKTLKRISNSRVKRTNLADLAAIRLDIPEVQTREYIDENEDGEEDDNFWKALEIENSPISPSEEGISVSFDHPTILKSEALIAQGTLDQIDADQLIRELELVKAGDTEALNRLHDLIYYLE
ncbi:MAG: Hsp70 family protein [Parachlamydiaceae bacterium]|nr:Hsp70 family protein [Parachlamydiaceae bacterium]